MTPTITDADRELADEIAKWSYSRLMGDKERVLYERTIEQFAPILAAHRAAGIAEDRARIRALVTDLAARANDRHWGNDLMKLAEQI